MHIRDREGVHKHFTRWASRILKIFGPLGDASTVHQHVQPSGTWDGYDTSHLQYVLTTCHSGSLSTETTGATGTDSTEQHKQFHTGSKTEAKTYSI